MKYKIILKDKNKNDIYETDTPDKFHNYLKELWQKGNYESKFLPPLTCIRNNMAQDMDEKIKSDHQAYAIPLSDIDPKELFYFDIYYTYD